MYGIAKLFGHNRKKKYPYFFEELKHKNSLYLYSTDTCYWVWPTYRCFSGFNNSNSFLNRSKMYIGPIKSGNYIYKEGFRCPRTGEYYYFDNKQFHHLKSVERIRLHPLTASDTIQGYDLCYVTQTDSTIIKYINHSDLQNRVVKYSDNFAITHISNTPRHHTSSDIFLHSESTPMYWVVPNLNGLDLTAGEKYKIGEKKGYIHGFLLDIKTKQYIGKMIVRIGVKKSGTPCYNDTIVDGPVMVSETALIKI